MDDSITLSIAAIESAVSACNQSNKGGVPSAGRFVKNKTLLIDTISNDIALLKSRYEQGEEQERIEEVCEHVIREIISCGNLYFHERENDTSFLDDNFTSDAYKY